MITGRNPSRFMCDNREKLTVQYTIKNIEKNLPEGSLPRKQEGIHRKMKRAPQIN